MKFELSFTVDEINQVLTALGRQPFDSVFLLVGKIRTECQAQIDAEAVNQNMTPIESD